MILSGSHLVTVHSGATTLLVNLRIVEASQIVKSHLTVRIQNQDRCEYFLIKIFNYYIEAGTVLLRVNHENGDISFSELSVKILDLKAVNQILMVAKLNSIGDLFTKQFNSFVIHRVLLIEIYQIFQ